MRAASLLALACAAAPAALAQARGEEDAAKFFRSVRAARRVGEIRLDGRPDEPAWEAAETGSGFLQLAPDEGAKATVETRFRVLWDDEAMYVGVECDDPLPPTATRSRRDRFVEGDYVSFDLDTTNDRRTAYHFQVYAGGQQVDGLHFNDVELTTDWDAVWESAVARTERGWSVEARIPLRILRIPDGARAFGFNLYRILARRREEDQWRFRPRAAAGDISLLGELTGLEGVKPVRSLELRPYFAARGTWTRPAPGRATARLGPASCSSFGYANGAVASACAGADLRYSLSGDASLAATINPDFGQVEADQRVLNLSTFETFFNEGLDLFQSPLRIQFGGPYGGDAYQFFYSRRIGPAPPEWDDDDGTLIYEPSARPVLGAVKLTGLLGRSSVGLLAAVEPRLVAEVRTSDGRVADLRVRDAVYSGAARIRTPLSPHALLGAFVTTVDPIGSGPTLAKLDRHAHVAGADFTTFDARRNWSFTAQTAGSLISGGPREVQQDGVVLRDGSSGAAVSAKLSKDSGDLVGFAGGDWLSPEFTVNDLGFMRRANLLRAFGYLQLRDVHPNDWRQRAFVGAWVREIRDARSALTLEQDTGFETYVLLNSQWSFGQSLFVQTPYVDDRELGDGTPLERQGSWNFGAYFNGDTRKPISVGAYADYGRAAPRYERVYDFGATLNLRPLAQLETTLDVAFIRSDGTIRRIRKATALPGTCADVVGPLCTGGAVELDRGTATQGFRTYLLAPQSSRSLSVTARGTYAFSPHLTLQLYAQLFGAGVAYGDALRALAVPGKRTVRFSDLAPAGADDLAPDKDNRQAGLNVNLIMRWEWKLGSTLYLVYAHQSASDFTPGRRGLAFADEVFAFADRRATHTDTFLVKIDLFAAL